MGRPDQALTSTDESSDHSNERCHEVVETRVDADTGGNSVRQPLAQDILDRFVYLVGPTRSGTTIITRSYFLIDQVFSFPNPTRFTHHVWLHRKKVDMRLLRQIFKKPSFYSERRVTRSLDEDMKNRVRRRIHDAFNPMNIAKMYQLYPLVYSLDPNCEQDPAKALCWADKANDIYGLFEIAREMPKAKFVFIVRDPRATIASMKGQIVRSREEIGLKGMKLTALISSCIYWRNIMQTFLRLAARYPDRVFFLHYEDFVNDAAEVINKAIEFGAGERVPQEALQAGRAQFKFKTKHDKSTIGKDMAARNANALGCHLVRAQYRHLHIRRYQRRDAAADIRDSTGGRDGRQR